MSYQVFIFFKILQGTSYENMTIIVQNYVEGLIRKYPYWNRTLGADHFFVTCHDVGVRAFEGLPFLIKNTIRVVCSPSYDVGYIPHKDVALPQVLQPFALPAGGNDIENRLESETCFTHIHATEGAMHFLFLIGIEQQIMNAQGSF